MKKRHRGKLFIALFALATTLSLSLAFAATWTSTTYITRVYGGYESGSVYIKGFENVAGCDSSTIKFTSSDSDPKKIEILARTAIVTNKKLQCQVDGCNGSYQRGNACSLYE